MRLSVKTLVSDKYIKKYFGESVAIKNAPIMEKRGWWK